MVKKIEEDILDKSMILSELEFDLICDFIKLRKKKHLSQREMGEMAHVIRETIAKIETRVVSPQINTLIKILEPLGYTLRIVKIDNKKKNI